MLLIEERNKVLVCTHRKWIYEEFPNFQFNFELSASFFSLFHSLCLDDIQRKDVISMIKREKHKFSDQQNRTWNVNNEQNDRRRGRRRRRRRRELEQAILC